MLHLYRCNMKSIKQIKHDYYMRKGRLKRKFKGATEIPHIRCFLCGKLIDYKKYLEKAPTIRIDMKLYSFGGRANIKVVDFTEINPEIQEFVKKVLINKLKSMLRALNEPYERVEPSIMYSGYPVNSVNSVEVKGNATNIPIIKSTEVKIW